MIEVVRELEGTLARVARLPSSGKRLLLDPATTLLPGDLGVVGARYLDDAERVLLRIALEAALDVFPRRWVLVVAADSNRMHLQMLAHVAGAPSVEEVESPSTRHELANLNYAVMTLRKAQIELVDVDALDAPLKWIGTWLAKHRGGVALLPAAWPVADRPHARAAAFIREAKAVSRATDGTVIVPWRVRPHVSTPLLSDLVGCGAVEDDADLVLLVHAGERGIDAVAVAKNRHGPLDASLDRAQLGDRQSESGTMAMGRVRKRATPPLVKKEPRAQPRFERASASGSAVEVGTPGLENETALLADVCALLTRGPLKSRVLVRLLAERGRIIERKVLNRVLYRARGSVPGLSVTDGTWRLSD